MPKITPYVDIEDVKKKLDMYTKTMEQSPKVFERTLKDMKSRAPGKVADAVRTVYNIKKNEITPVKTKQEVKKAGKIYVKGESIATLALFYEGRKLTPLHFGMTPKERPAKKKYKVKAKIKKEKKVFTQKNGGVFLAPVSKSLTVIPWKRLSSDRNDIEPIKTLSLPQMIGQYKDGKWQGNQEVREKIDKDIGELFNTRFNYHLSKHLDKGLKSE